MASVGNFWMLTLIVTFWLSYYSTAALSIDPTFRFTCEIPVWQMNATNYGIVLEPNPWRLKEPNLGYFQWINGASIYIGCGNEIRTIKCNDKTTNQHFVCRSAPLVDFKLTPNSCAKTGKQYQIGFVINKSRYSSDFVPYYEVCYNTADCSAIFSYHQLQGGSFNRIWKVPRIENRAFRRFSCNLDYNQLYLQSNQRTNPKINTSKGYLQRGHLFPDRDAPVYAWKLATYSYGNCAPEWETINSNGNWYKLEDMVYQMAIEMAEKYDIYDGVLYNPDQRNKIYLNQAAAKIEVPQWFWKVVISQHHFYAPFLKEAMVFFVYNDPYSSPATKFCAKDRCAEYNWHFENDIERGKTHCCLHGDLKKDTLPKEVMRAFSANMKGLKNIF